MGDNEWTYLLRIWLEPYAEQEPVMRLRLVELKSRKELFFKSLEELEAHLRTRMVRQRHYR